MSTRRCLVRHFGFGIFLMLAGPTWAEIVSTSSVSGPLSVTLEIELPGALPARVSTRDGGTVLYRVSEQDREISFAIVPHVDRDRGEVELRVVALADPTSILGSESAVAPEHEIDTVITTIGEDAFVRVVGVLLDLRVMDVSSRESFLDPGACGRPGVILRYPRPGGGGSGCCVICGGITVCGCAVSTECGSCSDPDC